MIYVLPLYIVVDDALTRELNARYCRCAVASDSEKKISGKIFRKNFFEVIEIPPPAYA